jgi:hypothetical protein
VKDHFDVNKKFSGDVTWNPELAVPLAKAKLTLLDLLKEKPDTLEYISETELGYGSKPEDKVLVLRFGIDTSQTVNLLSLPAMEAYDTTIYLKPISIPTANFKLPIAEKITDIINKAGQEYTLDGSGEALSNMFEYVYITEGEMFLTCFNTSSESIDCDIDLVVDSAGVRKPIGTFSFTDIPPLNITNIADWQAIADYITNGGEVPDVLKQSSQKITKQLKDQYVGEKLYYTYKNFAPHNATLFNSAQSLITLVEFGTLKIDQGKAQVPEQIISTDTTIYVTVSPDKIQQKLFEVHVEKGEINYDITSEIDIATHLIFTFPTITKNGVPIQSPEILINKDNSTAQGSMSFEGCVIDLTKSYQDKQPFNSLPIELSYRVEAGGMMEFNAEQYIDISIGNRDSIQFSYIRGNIGSGEEEILHDVVDFDIGEVLDVIGDNSITFADPRLNLRFDNPIAVGAAIDIDLSASNDKGETVQMFPEGARRIPIEAPDCAGVLNHEQKETKIELDSSQSNIVEFLHIMPNSIAYSGKLLYNPDDPTGMSENCISNQAEVELTIDVEVPLNVTLNNIIFSHDIALDKPLGETLGESVNLDTLSIRIDTKNSFPLDATLKITMLDTTQAVESAQFLGELPVQLLEAAPTDDKGKVTEAKTYVNEEIKVDGDLFKAFIHANKIRIEATLNTTDSDKGKSAILYSFYSIDVQISANGKFLINERL